MERPDNSSDRYRHDRQGVLYADDLDKYIDFLEAKIQAMQEENKRVKDGLCEIRNRLSDTFYNDLEKAWEEVIKLLKD